MLNNANRGFTLIELAVTLTIIGILASLAAPAFNTWIANARTRTLAETLANDLRLAQAEAVRRNRMVAVLLTTSSPVETTLTPASPAGNWSVRALPLLNSNENQASTNGSTSQIRHYTSSASSDTTVTSTSALTCFNSVGRLAGSASGIADAGGSSCSAPSTSTPNLYRIQNNAGNRPLWLQVSLGGKVRLCDPNRTLPEQADGCCDTACCSLSSASYCKF